MNQETLIKLLCLVYNTGYLNGHHQTVENYFTDIHFNDLETYHKDIVSEILEQFMEVN